jgi:hypothetical protein
MELGICIRFDHVKFIPQFYLLMTIETWFSRDHAKFHTVYPLFYQSSVDFLQINFTSYILYNTTTNSEELEDAIQ